MNYEEIKRLLDDMGNSKIDELKIEFPEGMKISMKKKEETVARVLTSEMPRVEVNNMAIHTKEIKEEENCKTITSPMVGTFYQSSSPKEEALVKVGDKVKKGDVLCIIEAMKLMNEIESEYEGEIIEICVKNEEMVEYGKPLFKIK